MADDSDEDDEGEQAQQQEDDDVASFTLTRRSGPRRRHDGPAADGSWDPLAGPDIVAAPAAAAARLQPRLAGLGDHTATRRVAPAAATEATSAVARRGRSRTGRGAAGRSTDLLAAEGEQEEEVPEPEAAWDEAGDDSDQGAPEVPGSGSGSGSGPSRTRATARGGRRRLGRRREVVRVSQSNIDDVEGEVD
jgi:hypothetical protein